MVAGPLAFELALVAVLLALTSKAENLATKEAVSHARMGKVALVLKSYVDSGQALVFYGFSRNEMFKDTYEQADAELVKQVDSLTTLGACDDDQQQVLKELRTETLKGIDSFRSAIKAISARDYSSRFLNAVYVRDELMQHLRKMRTYVIRIGEIEARYNPAEQHELAEQASQLAKTCVCFGFIANLILTIGMTLYFTRHIINRLARIVNNSYHLAKSEPLEPLIGGGDEIAHLDEVFHHMADALRNASQRERAIVEKSLDVICSLDPNLEFRAVNPAATKVWGHCPESLVGKSLLSMLLEEDLATVEKMMAEMRALPEASRSLELRLITDSGTALWMSWSIFWAATEQTYFCVARDIEEQKRMQQMKADFIRMVSHDVRTPLMSTQLFFDMALATTGYGQLNEKGKSLAIGLKASLSRVLRLLNDMLYLEKIDSGSVDLQIGAVPAADIVEAAIDTTNGIAHSKNVEIRLGASADAVVAADKDRIVQVLENFIGNALKFSKPGDAVIISTSMVDSTVEFRVSDCGPGIASSDKKTIFERFSQVSSEDERVRKGFGLGLAICKSIVESHDGTIGVDSSTGTGSSFWIRLPLLSAATPDDNEKRDSEAFTAKEPVDSSEAIGGHPAPCSEGPGHPHISNMYPAPNTVFIGDGSPSLVRKRFMQTRTDSGEISDSEDQTRCISTSIEKTC